MGATASLFKTLFLPAFFSLGVFLFLTYFLVPVWKRYREKYSRYLPLEAISSSSITIRDRIQAAIRRWLAPSAWSVDFNRDRFSHGADDTERDFDSDDGEELFEIDDRRREALSLDARRDRPSDGGRLSRDLEQGFRDDSDEDVPTRTQST